MACVEQARLRIDARLQLQRGHRQRAVDQDDRREREREQPRVRAPQRRDADAERGEDELGRDRLTGEETRLPD